jgi:hypothetical protein
LRYQKDYDAVVTLAVDHECTTVALEYERTAKSSPEYRRICAELSRESRVSAILYLAPSRQLQNFLLHALRESAHPVYVTLAGEFCANPRQADLIDVRFLQPAPLATCIRQISYRAGR